ncbi:MAG: OB-fold domain-containing protein [Quisquiliibacterium sp.]
MSEQKDPAQASAATKPQRAMPDPMTNPETERFYQATSRHELLIGHCKDCGKHHYYPRAICPHCLSDQTEWVQASGNGSIYSYSVLRRGVPVPYAIAYVTLDEGTTMLTNLVDCNLDALSIGQRVKLSFVASPNGTQVPVFKPA